LSRSIVANSAPDQGAHGHSPNNAVTLRMNIRPAVETEAQLLSALAMRAKAYWGYSVEALEGWRAELAVSPQGIRTRPTFVAMVGIEVAGFYSLSPLGRCWSSTISGSCRDSCTWALAGRFFRMPSRPRLAVGPRKSPSTPTRMPSRSILSAERSVAARFPHRFPDNRSAPVHNWRSM